jgi:(1->4)-alpha-D-glucan 1-alpha-D-glucosylmutase
VMADPRFLADVDQFHKAIAYFGWWNSLSQVLLELTSPGVPDIYQGNELWDFSLVDPDNRRPVDYPQRQKLLDQINAALEDDQGQLIRDLVENAQDGRIKLFLTAQTLQFRRDHAPLFDNGSYEPLQAEGDKARHVCAFTRQVDEAQIIVAVPVLNVALADGALRAPAGDVWEDTRLLVNDANGARYQNIFTGDLLTVENGSLALSAVLEQFPVAVLWRVIE